MDFIGTHWAVIEANPVPFFGVAIAFLLLGWAAGRFMFQERISILKERVEQFKEKTGEPTPEGAQARIAALEKRLDDLHDPRAFTQDQLTRLTNSLSGKSSWEVTISRDVASVESAKAQSQLISAFKRQGWQVESLASIGVENPPPCGLAVFTRTGDHRSLAEHFALAALDAAGIAYDLRREDRREKGVKVPELQIAFTDAEIE